MAQEVKMVARTFELGTVAEISGYDIEDLAKSTREELTVFSGKAAGVCYMPDNYMEDGIQNLENALKRAEQTSKSGHHSVYDHGYISFVIKTNKMIAMILNSLGVYTTSEKSGRYTGMKPESEFEIMNYEKWNKTIKQLILDKYPSIDDDMLRKAWLKKYPDGAGYIVKEGRLLEIEPVLQAIEDKEALKWFEDKRKSLYKSLPSTKLAQENARYMISIFTPTTMMYTISFRQAFLIVDYFTDLINQCKNAEDSFSKKLLKHLEEFVKALKDEIGESKLHDNKNQYIRFLEAQHVGQMEHGEFKKFEDLTERLSAKAKVVKDSYTLVYTGSLVMLAQAQRHRTLRYTMKLQEAGELGFYVPKIVEEAGLKEEWLKDIELVSYCIPQGTLVRITEQGLFEDFVLKCKERMCGRAQLEVMDKTKELVETFNEFKSELSYSNQRLLDNILEDGKACARCAFKDFKCTEGCTWGKNGALNRLI